MIIQNRRKTIMGKDCLGRVRNYMIRLLVPNQDHEIIYQVIYEINSKNDMPQVLKYLTDLGKHDVVLKMFTLINCRLYKI